MGTIENTVSLLRNATVEIIDVDISVLGISYEHLVRPIIDEDVDVLAETDETEWDALEIRLWPEEWEKPHPNVTYHVVSGNHRTRAARKKGLSTLKAKVIDAPDDLSYTIAAVHSNTRHGKNFTNDERHALAKKLSEMGQSLGEIAKVFSVHKTTVSNWLTGRDSNASKKKQNEHEINIALPVLSREDEDVHVRRKIIGLLAESPVDLDIATAQACVQSLSPDMQSSLQTLLSWLQDVLGGCER
jgi:transposase-like protein